MKGERFFEGLFGFVISFGISRPNEIAISLEALGLDRLLKFVQRAIAKNGIKFAYSAHLEISDLQVDWFVKNQQPKSFTMGKEQQRTTQEPRIIWSSQGGRNRFVFEFLRTKKTLDVEIIQISIFSLMHLSAREFNLKPRTKAFYVPIINELARSEKKNVGSSRRVIALNNTFIYCMWDWKLDLRIKGFANRFVAWSASHSAAALLLIHRS